MIQQITEISQPIISKSKIIARDLITLNIGFQIGQGWTLIKTLPRTIPIIKIEDKKLTATKETTQNKIGVLTD